jgi:alpha-1,6-mannosyltransferase
VNGVSTIAPVGATALRTVEAGGAFTRMGLLGATTMALTLATPFVFRAGGDNAYMVMAVATGLVAIVATSVAERAPSAKIFWMIVGVAVLLRGILLFIDPLLSTDIYRYVWDGKVQAHGINPYRYFPADEALTSLRDADIYPNMNRAGSAVTIYPPVAQTFFFLVTRLGENVTAMKLALLGCEAVTATVIVLLLRQLRHATTRLVAYAWHPLPLWEIANNGHIDALMVTLMMLGIWLALTGRPLRGAASIALSALAKPFSVVALPAVWRAWDWKLPLTVIVIVGLCYAPYLSVGWGVFGYLTTGYLQEEHLHTGDDVWPLAAWRRIAGVLPGDFVVYLAAFALIMATLAMLAAQREPRTAETSLADINRLLLAFLFLLSPNYPWYFLMATPFVALVGGAPVWAMTVGAVLLQDEATWDPFVPELIRKSLLYGAFLAACVYAAWRSWRRATPAGASSDEHEHAR